MNPIASDLKMALEENAALLRTLRDEIRVKIHLGTMEVKTEWGKLEPRLEDTLARAATDVSDASREAVHEMAKSVRKLRESLR